MMFCKISCCLKNKIHVTLSQTILMWCKRRCAWGTFLLLLTIAYRQPGHKSEFNCKLANKLRINTPWEAQHIPLPNYSTIHKELMASSLCFYI